MTSIDGLIKTLEERGLETEIRGHEPLRVAVTNPALGTHGRVVAIGEDGTGIRILLREEREDGRWDTVRAIDMPAGLFSGANIRFHGETVEAISGCLTGLRALRLARHLRLADLSARTGISTGRISEYERDPARCANMTVNTFIRFADGLANVITEGESDMSGILSHAFAAGWPVLRAWMRGEEDPLPYRFLLLRAKA